MSHCPTSDQNRRTATAARGQTQDGRPQLAKEFYALWQHAAPWIGRGSRAARGYAGHWSAGSEQLHCTSLVLYTLLLAVLLSSSSSSLLLFSCLTKLSLSQLASVTFPFPSPIPERELGGLEKGCVVFSCRPG